MRDAIEQRLFNTYRNIRQCCYNPNNKTYQSYQRAGIDLTCRFGTFAEFYTYVNRYLGPPPDLHSRVIRRDMLLGYEPGNLEWGSSKTQMQRQRSCQLIRYQGRTQCMTQWAEELGMSFWTISRRYHNGLPASKIFYPGPDSEFR